MYNRMMNARGGMGRGMGDAVSDALAQTQAEINGIQPALSYPQTAPALATGSTSTMLILAGAAALLLLTQKKRINRSNYHLNP